MAMTDNTVFLLRKLHYILHRSYIEARKLAQGQQHQQLFDLADYFELIPSMLDDLNETELARIRGYLTGYQAKYPASAVNYVYLLDMTEADFNALTKPWGEVAPGQKSTDAA
jgi:hypothetical protein